LEDRIHRMRFSWEAHYDAISSSRSRYKPVKSDHSTQVKRTNWKDILQPLRAISIKTDSHYHPRLLNLKILTSRNVWAKTAREASN
jgi:hypothetical protein